MLNKTEAALVHAPANVPLHPSFLYEIAFHTVALPTISSKTRPFTIGFLIASGILLVGTVTVMQAS